MRWANPQEVMYAIWTNEYDDDDEDDDEDDYDDEDDNDDEDDDENEYDDDDDDEDDNEEGDSGYEWEVKYTKEFEGICFIYLPVLNNVY